MSPQRRSHLGQLRGLESWKAEPEERTAAVPGQNARTRSDPGGSFGTPRSLGPLERAQRTPPAPAPALRAAAPGTQSWMAPTTAGLPRCCGAASPPSSSPRQPPPFPLTRVTCLCPANCQLETHPLRAEDHPASRSQGREPVHPGGAKTRVPSNPKLVQALSSGDSQGLGAGILPSRFPLVEEARG